MFDAAAYEPAPERAPTRPLGSLRGRGITASSSATEDDNARLTLDPAQACCGGELGGFVDLALPFTIDATFRVSLVATLSFSDEEKDDMTVWIESGLSVTEAGPTGTCVKFRFTLPPGAPPTGSYEATSIIGISPDSIEWTLAIQGERSRQSWEWEIPVKLLPTPAPASYNSRLLCESVSDVPETGRTRAPALARNPHQHRLHPEWLAFIETSNEGPASGSEGAWLGLGLAVVGALVVWMVNELGWFFVVFGALILGFTAYNTGAVSEFVFMEGALLVRRSWFGWKFQNRTIAAQRITDIEINPSPSQPVTLSGLSLSACLHDGSRVLLMGSLRESSQAHVLRRWIALILKQGVGGAHLEGELPLEAFFPNQ